MPVCKNGGPERRKSGFHNNWKTLILTGITLCPLRSSAASAILSRPQVTVVTSYCSWTSYKMKERLRKKTQSGNSDQPQCQNCLMVTSNNVVELYRWLCPSVQNSPYYMVWSVVLGTTHSLWTKGLDQQAGN